MVEWECINKIDNAGEETQRGHMVQVIAEKNRPIFEEDGEQKRGGARVTVSLRRNKVALFLSVPEAKIIHDALVKVLPAAEIAHRECEQQRNAWREQQDYTPGGNRGAHVVDTKERTVSSGKTAREKAKGKAGAAAHRARKLDKSEESKHVRNEMRSATGKKK